MVLRIGTLAGIGILFAGIVASPATISAQWSLDGNPVCTFQRNQRDPGIVPDGSGGAVVLWVDSRVLGSRDAYAQRITPEGAIEWPQDGVYLATNIGELWIPTGVPDGTGGAIVAWEDDADLNVTGLNIYAQRVTGEGAVAAGWPADGIAIATANGHQRGPRLAPDGSGGAFIAWYDGRDDPEDPDIYAVRVTADGTIAPGWVDGGTPIAVGPGGQRYPSIVADGVGGAFICWRDARNFAETDVDIYLQRMTAAGEVSPGWPENGLPVCTALGHQIFPVAVEDGLGGVFVVWEDGRVRPGFSDYLDIYGTRILGDGTIAPGWPVDGVPLCRAPDSQQDMEAVADGLGGVVVTWEDYRSYGLGTDTVSDIYAQRLLADGTIPPGWPADGVAVSVAPGFQLSPELTSDGAGGAYVVWEETRGGTLDIYAQHVLASGQLAFGWDANGVSVSTAVGSQTSMVVTTDGAGGALVAWDDSRLGGQQIDIYAHKLGLDGPVPTRPSLVSAEADESGIRLFWYAKDARWLEASVYRRTEGTAWGYVGAPEITGPDELRYDDPSVTPGERYAYRLGYFDGGIESFTDEVWVEAAAPLVFALDGFRPNPAVGLPIVSLTLAKSEAARLEVFDLRGRLVLRRDLSGLGAGRHSVSLDEGVRLAPGVYVLRLTQGDRVARVRGIILD